MNEEIFMTKNMENKFLELRDSIRGNIIYEIMKKLEEHKFCTEYHKITSKDNSDEYYKESCLFIIYKELKEQFDEIVSRKED